MQSTVRCGITYSTCKYQTCRSLKGTNYCSGSSTLCRPNTSSQFRLSLLIKKLYQLWLKLCSAIMKELLYVPQRDSTRRTTDPLSSRNTSGPKPRSARLSTLLPQRQAEVKVPLYLYADTRQQVSSSKLFLSCLFIFASLCSPREKPTLGIGQK